MRAYKYVYNKNETKIVNDRRISQRKNRKMLTSNALNNEKFDERYFMYIILITITLDVLQK